MTTPQEIGKAYERYVVDYKNAHETNRNLKYIHGRDMPLVHFVQIFDPDKSLIRKYKPLPVLLNRLRREGTLHTTRRQDSPLVGIDLYAVRLDDDTVVVVLDAKYTTTGKLAVKQCTSAQFFAALQREQPSIGVGYVTNVTCFENGIHLPVETVPYDPHRPTLTMRAPVKPHAYQTAMVSALRHGLADGETRFYFVGPTGCGKSLLLALFIGVVCETTSTGPIVVVCPTIELCNQLKESIGRDLPPHVGCEVEVAHCRIATNVKARILQEVHRPNRVSVMVQKTFMELQADLADAILLVDEAHNLAKAYQLASRLCIGVSAIVPPERLCASSHRTSYVEVLASRAIVPVQMLLPSDDEPYLSPEREAVRVASLIVQNGGWFHLVVAPLLKCDDVESLREALVAALTDLVPDWFATEFRRVDVPLLEGDSRLLRDARAVAVVSAAIDRVGAEAGIVTIPPGEAVAQLGIDDADKALVDADTLVFHRKSGTVWRANGVFVGVQTHRHKTSDLKAFADACTQYAPSQRRIHISILQALEGINIPPLTHTVIAGEAPQCEKRLLQVSTRTNRAFVGKARGTTSFSHRPSDEVLARMTDEYDPEGDVFHFDTYDVDIHTLLQRPVDRCARARHEVLERLQKASVPPRPGVCGYDQNTLCFLECLGRMHPSAPPPTDIVVSSSGRRFQWRMRLEDICRRYNHKHVRASAQYGVVATILQTLPYSPLLTYRGLRQTVLPMSTPRQVHRLTMLSARDRPSFRAVGGDAPSPLGAVKAQGGFCFPRIVDALVALIDEKGLRSNYPRAPPSLRYDASVLFDGRDVVERASACKASTRWPDNKHLPIDFEAHAAYTESLRHHAPILCDNRLWRCVYEYVACLASSDNHIDTLSVLAKLQLGLPFATSSAKRKRCADSKLVATTLLFDCGPIDLSQNVGRLKKMCEVHVERENCAITDHTLEWVFTKMLQPQLYMLMALNTWSSTTSNLSPRLLTPIKIYSDKSDGV